MKKIIILAALIISYSAMASSPVGKAAFFYYIELPPNQKLTLLLQSNRVCPGNKEQIVTHQFETTAPYTSAENWKKAAALIKNVYAEFYPSCSNLIDGKIEKRIVIGPFKKRMTHIRLTTSENLQVTQVSE